MAYYFKLDSNNIVIDATTYEHDGYVKTALDEVPKDVLNGIYEYVNDTLQVSELAKKIKQDLPVDIKYLKQIKEKGKNVRLEYMTTENLLERQTQAGHDTTQTQAMLDALSQKGDIIQQELEAQQQKMMTDYDMTMQEIVEILLEG